MSEQRDEHIKALIEQQTDQRRRESDRAAARQRGGLLIAEREKSLPADVPLHKRGFGIMGRGRAMSDRLALANAIEEAGIPRDKAQPTRIGPVEFEQFGAKWVAVRCPSEFNGLMRSTGGLWEAGSHRWLIERRRVGPLIRKLQRMTDPLFRRVGIDLDG